MEFDIKHGLVTPADKAEYSAAAQIAAIERQTSVIEKQIEEAKNAASAAQKEAKRARKYTLWTIIIMVASFAFSVFSFFASK